jgi:hypothetical protein
MQLNQKFPMILALMVLTIASDSWSKGGGGPPPPPPPPLPPLPLTKVTVPSIPTSGPVNPQRPSPERPVMPKLSSSFWSKKCKPQLAIHMQAQVDAAQSTITGDTSSHSGAAASDAVAHSSTQTLVTTFQKSMVKFVADYPENAQFPAQAPSGGSAKIKGAYDKFSLAGNQFLKDVSPGGRIYQLAQICTVGRRDMQKGPFQTDIDSTKRFLLERYYFTAAASQNGTDADSTAQLSKASEVAESDVADCPKHVWSEAQKKFLYMPPPEQTGGKPPCSQEQYDQYRKNVNDSFQTVIQALEI